MRSFINMTIQHQVYW